MTFKHGDPVTGDGITGTIVNVAGPGPLTNVDNTPVWGVETAAGEIRFYRADRLNAEKVGVPPEGETPT
ncbi:hypothetical protein [Agromyces lapidis]|uniref:DUF1918 domain-containing protein n=1 Tax=Agromyces lapidis TaxID=279574 RepID=A0ABV5SP67_9MICO|nr:hypothetical protein [Agromyces lapidis]